MGLLSDTLEDNRERFGRIEMGEYQPIELPPAMPPEVACPVCDQLLGSDLAMQNHIAREHAQSHVYIKTADRVVRSTEIFSKRPSRCELILLGVDEVNVALSTGTLSARFIVRTSANLLEHVPTDYTGEVRVDVWHGRICKQFLMYFGTTPPFDQTELDKAVIDVQRRLETGGELDWAEYQRRQRELSRNELEKRYLDGFLEYSLAFDLEKRSRWRESTPHLEAAMYLLRPYGTPLARTARRVLAIRMNCFSSLAQCLPTSVFYRARAFFVDKLNDLPAAALPALRTSDDFVYVDGFTDRLLGVLKAFYARDFTNVFTRIDHLAEHPLAEDKNNEDKLLLLRARASLLDGKERSACRSYERLRYHPIFGAEAQEFLKGRRRA